MEKIHLKLQKITARFLLTVKQIEEHGIKKYDIYNDRNVHLFSLE